MILYALLFICSGACGDSGEGLITFPDRASCQAAADKYGTQTLNDGFNFKNGADGKLYGTEVNKRTIHAECYRLPLEKSVPGYWNRFCPSSCNANDGSPLSTCGALICKPTWVPGDPPQPQPNPSAYDCQQWDNTLPLCPGYKPPLNH